jgi:hypothetical protein
LQSKFFSRQNSLFQITKEKFGGKKFTLQRTRSFKNVLQFSISAFPIHLKLPQTPKSQHKSNNLLNTHYLFKLAIIANLSRNEKKLVSNQLEIEIHRLVKLVIWMTFNLKYLNF